MPFQVLALDNISNTGLSRFPSEHYQIRSDTSNPDVILVRSSSLHDFIFPPDLLAVGRAGAGVNNIPIAKLNAHGIPDFNTPGANANAVKELVLAGLLLASRHLAPAIDYVRQLEGSDDVLHQRIEQDKKRFVGNELPGKTLGVIGLGAVGVQVANAAQALGMRVIGYDPAITIERAWQLSARIIQAKRLEEVLQQSDFVSLHVPLIKQTEKLINAQALVKMHRDAILLNFSRAGVVDEIAIEDALQEHRLSTYVCDFPSQRLKNHPHVIALPHLGASTLEAQENCAMMIVDQIRDFLEQGSIHYAVNLPDVIMPFTEGAHRIAIVNANVPNMVGQISTALANATLNILELANKSQGDLAYTLLDVDKVIPPAVMTTLRSIDGILSLRQI